MLQTDGYVAYDIYETRDGITLFGCMAHARRKFQNGQVEIDNNLIENSIRPVALGRKNYLFAGSHEVAQQVAMIYSFLDTCKINNIEPYGWLKDVLQRIPDQSIQKLDELPTPSINFSEIFHQGSIHNKSSS